MGRQTSAPLPAGGRKPVFPELCLHSGGSLRSFECQSSSAEWAILADPCTRLLVEAGADALEGVNQAAVGDEALSDAEVFPTLKALLGPLFAAPPHALDFMHNNLSRAAAERLVRFAEAEPTLRSLVGLDAFKVAAQNQLAEDDAAAADDDPNSDDAPGTSAQLEAKVADWCADGLPLLYRPAFPDGIASPGHVARLAPGTRFSCRASRQMTVRLFDHSLQALPRRCSCFGRFFLGVLCG
jgi:hypothetical protein